MSTEIVDLGVSIADDGSIQVGLASRHGLAGIKGRTREEFDNEARNIIFQKYEEVTMIKVIVQDKDPYLIRREEPTP